MFELLSLLLLATGSLAGVDNTAVANDLADGAAVWRYGYYYIKSALDGSTITMVKEDGKGYHFWPSTQGSGTPIEFMPHNASTAYVHLRPDKTKQCASAQWNGKYCNGHGCDWAAAVRADR
jgi:hypothetical protein